jgi:hypothetical protein
VGGTTNVKQLCKYWRRGNSNFSGEIVVEGWSFIAPVDGVVET